MTTTAPKQAESVPAVTAPVNLPALIRSNVRGWQISATVSGVVAVGTLIVGMVVS